MKKLNLWLCFVAVLIFTSNGFAQGGGQKMLTEEEHFENAKRDTVNLLKDREQRENAIQESDDAKKAGDRVKGLAGDQKTEDKYYELSSEIFNDFKDEKSMREIIEKAQKDPTSFYQNLTPEQREKIKELSRKINPAAAGPSNP
jgi:hypothetical protein